MEGLSCAHVTLPSGMRLRYLSNRVPRGSLCVLFVHGWPSLAFSWRNQLRACPLHAIAPDLPGFGGSDRPSDPKCLSQRSLTATMLQLLTALEVQRVVVVGHDWGGVVTWSLALTQDERIVGAAALCTPLFPYVGGDAVERMRENPRAFDYQVRRRKRAKCKIANLSCCRASCISWRRAAKWLRQSSTATWSAH